MPRILVTPTLLLNVRGTCREILEKAGFEVVYPSIEEFRLRGRELIGQLEGISGVVCGGEPYTREVLRETKLRAMARVGVGYDAVDLAAANELGMVVTIAPGTNENSVAEQTFALLFGVFREVAVRDQEVRRGNWKRAPLWRLEGRTIGIVGLGRIGRATVWRAQGLGLKVIGYDTLPDREYAARQNVELVSFDELLAWSDIVSLHTPCTPETVDLINAQSLAKMKKGAVLINTARGGLVDEAALVDALQSGHLAGAGLDVFKVEPLPTDSPLLKLPNVVTAPHMGGLDEESLEAMSAKAADCLAKLFQGQWPDGCVVNENLRPGWKW